MNLDLLSIIFYYSDVNAKLNFPLHHSYKKYRKIKINNVMIPIRNWNHLVELKTTIRMLREPLFEVFMRGFHEVNVTFNDEGVVFTFPDGPSYFVNKTYFLYYHCPLMLTIGINVSNFNIIFRNENLSNKISWFIDKEEPNILCIEIKN